MRVWIFFHESEPANHPEAHEINRFLETAKRMGIDVKVLKPTDFELIVDSDSAWSALYDGKELAKPDIIIARTGSETSYFMLAVMRHFESQGVILCNGSEAIESVSDKLHTQQILASHNLPTPKTMLAKFPVDVDVIGQQLGFPVVVKTLRGTRGSGVVLCESREQFKDLANLLDGANVGADFIFQQYIKASHGRDVRLLVVHGQVVAAMERVATDGGFKSNVSLGGEARLFDAPFDMKRLAVDVANALNLDIAGVDILFDENGYKVCEANSAPGFKGMEKACKIDVPELIFRAVMDKHGFDTPVPPKAKNPLKNFSAWLAKIKQPFHFGFDREAA